MWTSLQDGTGWWYLLGGNRGCQFQHPGYCTANFRLLLQKGSVQKQPLDTAPNALNWMDPMLMRNSAPSTSFTSKLRKKSIIEHASLFRAICSWTLLPWKQAGIKRTPSSTRERMWAHSYTACVQEIIHKPSKAWMGEGRRLEWHSLGKSTWKSGWISVIYYTNVTQKCSWITLPSLHHISTSSSQPTTNRC